ncbi:MAG: peroxiredoxin [Alphaproteobacteria bacterium]|nr:peroxiredoxin [Alphaproteobacteria bacterium]
MIAPGDDIPSVPVKLVDAAGSADADARDVLSADRVVFFTVPGAFTPTCHTNHLPGYIELADQIRARGVSRIVCGTVNDHHVVKAWAKASGALDAVVFIADGNAALCRALGLDKDMSASGMGTRYIRAAIVIDRGKVEAVYAEQAPGEVTTSGAHAVLASL